MVLLASYFRQHPILASCPWGLATAHGVGLLTEMYATFYGEVHASHQLFASLYHRSGLDLELSA